MKVLLIYNPFSGNKTFKNNLDYIINKFQEKNYQIIPYRMDDDLDEMISNINNNSYNRILVAGGDGTIHQTINSLIKNSIDIPLGIFPVGTANDFAQNLNLPKTIEEMTKIALSENYIVSDVGCVNNRYFINVASLGFIIDVSQKTDNKAKNNLGILAYYIKGLEELPNMKALNVSVKSETINFLGEIYFMLIMNGKSAGGFKKIAPFSSIDDGLLDVYIFKKCPLYELMSLLIKVFNGEHLNSSYVIYFQTDKLSVDCNDCMGTDLDGEEGPVFPLHIQNVPGKLRILTQVVPKII